MNIDERITKILQTIHNLHGKKISEIDSAIDSAAIFVSNHLNEIKKTK